MTATTIQPATAGAGLPVVGDDPKTAGPNSESAVLGEAPETTQPAVERNLANPTVRAGLTVVRPEIKVRQLFHHAYRVQDSEATRHFYEDVLAMPLLATFVETWDPVNDGPTNYIHTYFGLGDGSALAFFQFEHDNVSPTGFSPVNPFDQHIALYMDSLDSLRETQARLQAEGIPIMEIDHGYCYSLYIHDPSGLQVELAVDVPGTDAIMAEAAPLARTTLDNWIAGIRDGNNKWRGSGMPG